MLWISSYLNSYPHIHSLVRSFLESQVPSACVGGWPLVHPSVPLLLLDAWPVRRWRCDQFLRVTSGWLGSLRRSPGLHPGQSSEHGPLGWNPPKQSWGARKEVVHEERSSWRSGSITWRRWPGLCFLWPSQKLLCLGQTHHGRPGSPNKGWYLPLLDPVLGPATVCENASNSRHPCGRHSVVISCWDDWGEREMRTLRGPAPQVGKFSCN